MIIRFKIIKFWKISINRGPYLKTGKSHYGPLNSNRYLNHILKMI